MSNFKWLTSLVKTAKFNTNKLSVTAFTLVVQISSPWVCIMTRGNKNRCNTLADWVNYIKKAIQHLTCMEVMTNNLSRCEETFYEKNFTSREVFSTPASKLQSMEHPIARTENNFIANLGHCIVFVSSSMIYPLPSSTSLYTCKLQALLNYTA